MASRAPPDAAVPSVAHPCLGLRRMAREGRMGVTQAEAYAPMYGQRGGETPFALAADAE